MRGRQHDMLNVLGEKKYGWRERRKDRGSNDQVKKRGRKKGQERGSKEVGKNGRRDGRGMEG